MDAPAYNKLLELIDAAKFPLSAHTGELSSADLRIRCLLNITADEARRALLEIRAGSRFWDTNGPPNPVRPGNGARAHSSSAGTPQ